MNTVVILADTTIRSYLSAYGNDWTRTPNLDRLARRSTIFDNHWCGSAPCMPARRDLFTGRLNFLERPWGGAEAFDELLPDVLRREASVYSHLTTDHTFYWTPGGENFHWAFDSWHLERGQEHDNYHSLNQDFEIPEHHGQWSQQYFKNQMLFKKEEDYPSPRSFQNAINWLDNNHGSDHFMLWVECFDPHEPFDTPQAYLDLYDDDYKGKTYFWPTYERCSDTEEERRHIQKRYAATLSMTDHWIGKLLDQFDRYGLWEDTAVIFTTDHGYLLGEHGYLAKNYMPAYNEIFHIPLFIACPQVEGGRRIKALTQTTDLFPTILEYHGVDLSTLPNKIHGKSLWPLLDGRCSAIRDTLIYGYFGKAVNLTDGQYTYFRVPAREDNQPLHVYASLPSTLRQYMGIHHVSDLTQIDCGPYLSWTDYPVYRIPGQAFHFLNDSQQFKTRGEYNTENLLFDFVHDYAQMHPIHDEVLEEKYKQMLSQALLEHDSPPEQWARLGL